MSIASPTRVTYLVKQLELIIRSQMDDLVGALGVTALQYTALSVLSRHPGMSSAELSRRSFVTAQAGNEMIGTLEHKGLITRAPDAANRRILRVSLTEKGQRLLADCDAKVDGLEQRMLRALAANSRDELRRSLIACTHALREPVDGQVGASGSPQE